MAMVFVSQVNCKLDAQGVAKKITFELTFFLSISEKAPIYEEKISKNILVNLADVQWSLPRFEVYEFQIIDQKYTSIRNAC